MQKGSGHRLSSAPLSSRSLPTFHQFSIHSPPRGLGSQEVCMLSLPGHLPGPLG